MNSARCLRAEAQPWATFSGLRNTSRGCPVASSEASRSIAARSDEANSRCAPLSIQSPPAGTIRAVMKHPGRIGFKALGPALARIR